MSWLLVLLITPAGTPESSEGPSTILEVPSILETIPMETKELCEAASFTVRSETGYANANVAVACVQTMP